MEFWERSNYRHSEKLRKKISAFLYFKVNRVGMNKWSLGDLGDNKTFVGFYNDVYMSLYIFQNL